MKKNMKYFLKDVLNAKEIALMPNAFDVVGDIMIFADFPVELAKKEGRIADAVLRNYPHVKVITKKVKQFSGRFRLPKLKIIGGERRKETTHKENGVLLELHVENAYFSPRLGTERQRIASQVKPGESILVMFSGVGPYVVELAKHTPCKEVFGVEMNPAAHHYAEVNVIRNKVGGKVQLFLGDVKKVVPQLGKQFDRILMPLPKGADEYLPTALSAAKKNCVIHLYDFLEESEFGEAKEKVTAACAKEGRKCRILSIVECGKYSPSHSRVCIDFKVM